mgnify:CR=1 FL=1
MALEKEQLQENLITFCDGLPDDLITQLCQVVVDYKEDIERSRDEVEKVLIKPFNPDQEAT